MSSKSSKSSSPAPEAKRVTDAALDRIEAALGNLAEVIAEATDGVDRRDDRRVKGLAVMRVHAAEILPNKLAHLRGSAD